MLGFVQSAHAARNDYAACSGCSLCQLVCPVWRRTRDLRLTPHGRAKALQHGATIADIAPSIEACALCGACEPVCPENIGLVDMVMNLRRALPPSTIAQDLQTRMQEETSRPLATRSASARALLAGAALFRRRALLAHISALLGGARRIAVESDNGADIALALEIGAALPPQRIERFLAPLRLRKTIIVADGMLRRSLRGWLPRAQIVSLGVALSTLAPIRRRLRAGDLYVIEPRAYHADYDTLVKYYDRLRVDTGCAMNLDLQRIAIPAATSSLPQRLGRETPADGEQLRWLLKGRSVSRIVVENEDDRAAFEQVCAIPVVHLAELADHEALTEGMHS